jgi:hypothetical protein
MEEAVSGLVWDLMLNLDEVGDSEWQDRKINGSSFQPHCVIRQFIRSQSESEPYDNHSVRGSVRETSVPVYVIWQ